MKIDPALYDRLVRYCSYRDRAESEVIKKMRQLGIPDEAQALYLDELKEEGVLDEARFARSYAEGKSRIKKWGKKKIRMHLMALAVPRPLIDQALDQLPDSDYLESVRELAEYKMARVKGSDEREKKSKVFRYLQQKGYETELIYQVLFDGK